MVETEDILVIGGLLAGAYFFGPFILDWITTIQFPAWAQNIIDMLTKNLLLVLIIIILLLVSYNPRRK